LAKNLGCRVTGISTSRVGVEIATQRAPEHGVDYRVRFLVADGMDTRLPDASFDRAWVMESSHLMDDKARLLAECGRVLRVGGRLVLCDVILYHRLGIHEVVQKAREFDLLRRVFGRAKMATLDEYTAWALAAGIIVETREDLTNATRPTFARWRENAEARRPEIVETIGADSWADLVRSCDVLRAFWDDGILGYGLVMGTRVQ
jgi:ubiquinone/menaquinone biosynthesis C-methylase UbiE